MKPVSYQRMASSLNGGQKDVGLDCLLSTSKVMYCEKCGFVSADSTVFKKHMLEHMGTRFYCFYCNNVSYSEAELHVHLKQHTAKYPYKCHYCGQVYMRRQCLVKHIERLHGKSVDQRLSKPDTHAPVSSVLPRVLTTDVSPVRPTVKVRVPTTITPQVRLDEDLQRGKAVDTNATSVPKVAELLSPLHELIQHNRALTVSLPEEVTIPAGCLVELVEVKTVNGTKELKLRLVSQQENGSVIKDSRTTGSQNTTLGKPSAAALNSPNTVKPPNMGVCTVNRKQCEIKSPNVHRPVVPVSVARNIPNQISKDKRGIKRTLQEMMNLNVESPAVVPTKVSKTMQNPAREGNCVIKNLQREMVSVHVAPPTNVLTKTTNTLTNMLNPENLGTGVSQRTLNEKKNLLPEHLKSIPPRMVHDVKRAPQDLQVAVKEEPCYITSKNSTTANIKEERVGQNQQSLMSACISLSVPLAAHNQETSSTLLDRKVNATTDPSCLLLDTACRTSVDSSLTKQPREDGGSTLTDSKASPWAQSGRCNEKPFEGDTSEPEGFPVISSVFSLSQQPEDVQGSIQPLVLALRGIVMSKNNCSVKMTSDPIKTPDVITRHAEETPTSGHSQVIATAVSSNHNQLLAPAETVKTEEADKHSQTLLGSCVTIKEETNGTTPKDNNKCNQSVTPKSQPSTDEQEAAGIASCADASVTESPVQRVSDVAANEQDISSRFLTVTLKRIQLGSWRHSKKRLKLKKASKAKTQVPTGSLMDSAVFHPLPLKEDQLVKRPGPNQPVVVLNHPKPQVPKRGEGTTTFADTGTSEVVPKCQILKMRLSKVMGQKYEVMGCTVRFYP
ncbi:uncharacterized protein znf518b [Myripristis murdjan]|uniref:C2H2-type domain-containing protein n=1 Tax=Myripristis murdjan TaxID=586833 RepID=A0A667X0V7_9TELE|nr:zinc finger protein 518B [Myripristis murdjan]